MMHALPRPDPNDNEFFDITSTNQRSIDKQADNAPPGGHAGALQMLHDLAPFLHCHDA
jgi:hypothetical protein